eukprot:976834-Amphidinium_carterae.2
MEEHEGAREAEFFHWWPTVGLKGVVITEQEARDTGRELFKRSGTFGSPQLQRRDYSSLQ